MITAAHVQQVFAHEHVALRRFARAPELCDRRACSAFEVWGGGFVYLSTRDRPDFVVVVLPTVRDAVRIGRLRPGSATRRENVLLLYLQSKTPKLRMVLRTFGRI